MFRVKGGLVQMSVTVKRKSKVVVTTADNHCMSDLSEACKANGLKKPSTDTQCKHTS